MSGFGFGFGFSPLGALLNPLPEPPDGALQFEDSENYLQFEDSEEYLLFEEI